jgi:hypothetical protein
MGGRMRKGGELPCSLVLKRGKKDFRGERRELS